MKFSSLTQAVAVVVILTTSNAADDENFIKMTSTFQSILKKDIIYQVTPVWGDFMFSVRFRRRVRVRVRRRRNDFCFSRQNGLS